MMMRHLRIYISVLLAWYSFENVNGNGANKCPCISYFNMVEYDCLFLKIDNGRPLNDTCMAIIQHLAPDFHAVVLVSNADIDCEKEHSFYKVMPEGGLKVSNVSLSVESCKNMKQKFSLYLRERKFLKFLAANMEARKQKPQFLIQLTHFRQDRRITTCLHENYYCQGCSFLLSVDISYSNRTFNHYKATRWYNDVEAAYLNTTPKAHYNSSHMLVATYLLDSQTTVNVGMPNHKLVLRWPSEANKTEHSVTFYPLLVQSLHDDADYTELDQLVEWDPDLRITAVRVYDNSSISFSMQWRCPWNWKMTPKSFQVFCGYLILNSTNMGHSESCQQCFDTQDKQVCDLCNDYSSNGNKELGPYTMTEVPWNESYATLEIKTTFFGNIYENETIIHLPTSVQRLTNILKYNYFTGPHANYSFMAVDMKGSLATPYFRQSILLPVFSDNPQPLSDAEVSNLAAVCKVRAKSLASNQRTPKLSTWSNTVSIKLDKNVQPVKLLVVEHDSYHKFIFGCAIRSCHSRQLLLEYNVHKDSFTETSVSKNWGNCQAPITDIGPQGISQIYDECGTEEMNFSINALDRRAGCYHWLFRRWYVFVKSEDSELYKLATFDGDVDQLTLKQIPWKLWPITLLHSPHQIKCPLLHAYLFWSRMDEKSTQAHIYKIWLNDTSGDPTDHMEELESEKLCACSNSASVSMPDIDVTYKNLQDPSSAELAVLCGNSICGINVVETKATASHKIHTFSNETVITSFGLDQHHMFYISEACQSQIIKLNYGLTNEDRWTITRLNNEYKTTKTVPECGDWPDIFASILVPDEEWSLPVPPRECILPKISSNSFSMESQVTGHLLIRRNVDNSQRCKEFAKPSVIYEIQYAQMTIAPENASCKNSNSLLEKMAVELDCKKIRIQSSDLLVSHLVGNLTASKYIYFEIRALPNLEQKTLDLWYSDAISSVQKIILIAFYKPVTPGYSLHECVLLGVSIPALIAVITVCVTVIWWYSHKRFMYRHLKRISSRDIHCEEKLGEGHFAEAWRAKMDDEVIVVKILKESANEKQEMEFRDEALLLSRFKSVFVVRAIGICMQSRPIMLAMEFLDGGSLDQYLRKTEVRCTIDAEDLFLIANNALAGCKYLESEGYIHRDLSARNCLVSLHSGSNKPKAVKLSDFGLAKDIGNQSAYSSRDPDADVLPTAWTPPEAFSGQFSSKSDVWAYGVLLWEVFSFAAVPYGQCCMGGSHHCPLKTLNHHDIEYAVCVDRRTLADHQEPCTAAFCPKLRKLFSLCWSYSPEDRPSFKQLNNYLKAAESEILAVSISDFQQDLANTPSHKSSKFPRLTAAYGSGDSSKPFLCTSAPLGGKSSEIGGPVSGGNTEVRLDETSC